MVLLLSSTAGSFCTSAHDTKISQVLGAGGFGSTLPQNVLAALQGKSVELGTRKSQVLDTLPHLPAPAWLQGPHSCSPAGF